MAYNRIHSLMIKPQGDKILQFIGFTHIVGKTFVSLQDKNKKVTLTENF